MRDLPSALKFVRAAGRGMLRQLQPVDETSREKPQAYVPASEAGWATLIRYDSAVVSMRDGSGAAWYKRQPEEFRRQLARKAVSLIGSEAWVVDDTGFVKDGPASPGVARQYSGTLGKIGNVQIGVSIHAVTDQASCPLDWRLFLPEAWDDTCSDSNEHADLVTAREHSEAAAPQRA